MTVRANPIDWCLCDRCVAAFREQMRAKYRDVAALNDSAASASGRPRATRPEGSSSS